MKLDFLTRNKRWQKYVQECQESDKLLEEYWQQQQKDFNVFGGAVFKAVAAKGSRFLVGKDYQNTIAYYGIPVSYDPALEDSEVRFIMLVK